MTDSGGRIAQKKKTSNTTSNSLLDRFSRATAAKIDIKRSNFVESKIIFRSLKQNMRRNVFFFKEYNFKIKFECSFCFTHPIYCFIVFFNVILPFTPLIQEKIQIILCFNTILKLRKEKNFHTIPNNKKHTFSFSHIFSGIFWLTESRLTSPMAPAMPLGTSEAADEGGSASAVSCLMWLAADVVAAPFWGFVASRSTFKEAIACNCVAFSSTFPEKKINQCITMKD